MCAGAGVARRNFSPTEMEDIVIRFRHAVVALTLVPALAAAQRGGRDRGTRSNFDELATESTPAVQLTRGDLEDMSPVHLLLDKKKQLKLTDDQQKQLKQLEGTLKEKNQALFKSLDSLRQALRTRPGVDADEEKARLAVARLQFGGVVDGIRENYVGAEKEALPLLDETQRTTAADLLSKLAKESEETMKTKMGLSRGAGGRGRGRP